MENIIYLGIGLAIGVIVTWLIFNAKKSNLGFEPRAAELELSNSALNAKLDAAQEERKRVADQLAIAIKEGMNTSNNLAAKEEELRGLEKRLQENKVNLEQLQVQFKTGFENIAHKILEDNSKKFSEQNKTQIDDLLKPLGEKIKDFEKKVNDVYVEEGKERATLKEQLTQLQSLNVQMSKDAQNLTNALKGENKTAGNWGEMILESILEKSGLVKDEQYRAQKSFTSEDGKIYQPDFVVDLPGNKSMVIDAKVSLVGYERFASADNKEEQNAGIKEHITSVRKHVKELSEKKYQKIYQLNTLDFILLFMPIEPAFSAALQNDRELFNFAFDRNIIIVSPTTLLATLRTVDNFWKQEFQNRNVLKIAEEAALMYDKFVGFTESLLELGKKMEDSKKSYDTAMNRLFTGSGNVIIKIESLKKLGLKVSKSIDQKLIEGAQESDFPNQNEK